MEKSHRYFFENFVKVTEGLQGVIAIYLVNVSTLEMMRKIYTNIHRSEEISSLLNRAVPLLKKDELDLILLDAEELIMAERISQGYIAVVTMKKGTNYGKIFTVMKNIKKEISGGEDVRGQN